LSQKRKGNNGIHLKVKIKPKRIISIPQVAVMAFIVFSKTALSILAFNNYLPYKTGSFLRAFAPLWH